MSRISLAKKLVPARKAWKSFTKTLQSKLHKLNISKAIKTISKSIKTTTPRLLPWLSSLPFLVPFKRRRRPLKPSSTFSGNILYSRSHQNLAAIYIDELFDEHVREHVPMHAKHFHAETSKGKGKEVLEDKALPRKGKASAGEKSVYSVDDAWRAVVASSPQLRGVDERAEEFISKFREDMQLQREESILDFQEMLARSA